MSFLNVAREAHKMTPLAVVSSIEYWCERHLNSKTAEVREATELWLLEEIFDPDPISDSPALDSCRVRQTRKLMQVCISPVKTAYEREQSRTKLESTINTILAAEKYLLGAQMAGKVRRQSSDTATRASVSNMLLCELDELPPLLDELKELRELEAEWEYNEPLPNPRRSMDIETEFTTDGDSDDYWDEEGEPMK
jgi:hypothetical protein